MVLSITLLAAIIGYLFGSLSFARIITRLVSPQTEIQKIEEPVPDTDIVFESDSVSATVVRMNVGTSFGCLTAILDMLKVAIPVGAFMLWQPEQKYFLITAATGLIGHNFPIYHQFKGGRGESPIYGALFVIDPVGVVVTTLTGFLVGILAGNLLILRWAGLVLLIPWMWFRTHDMAYIGYMIFANIIYWWAMTPELKQYFKLTEVNLDPSQEELATFLGMGSKLGRFLDRYNLPTLIKNISQR